MIIRRLSLLLLVGAATAITTGSGSTADATDIPECGRVDGDGLIAFIGEKIEVEEVIDPPPEPGTLIIVLDEHYRARYRVVEKICGDYAEKEIEFDVFSHRGYPSFARYETVLLYVSRYGDRYVHQKYQFDDVYKDRSGEWVGCGDPYMGEPPERKREFHAVPLEFDEPPVFPVAHLTEEQVAKYYPPKYFSRKGDSVTCLAGVTAEILYAVRRLGVLKRREQLR